MFEKIAKSADDVLKDLAGLAFDPKVISYILQLPNNKDKKYELTKMSELHNKKTPIAKKNIIQTPTTVPFNPSSTITQGIQKEQSIPKTSQPNVAIPKPTYQGLSAGEMSQISRSHMAPFKKSIGLFNISKRI
jgi:hypothetical protein